MKPNVAKKQCRICVYLLWVEQPVVFRICGACSLFATLVRKTLGGHNVCLGTSYFRIFYIYIQHNAELLSGRKRRTKRRFDRTNLGLDWFFTKA